MAGHRDAEPNALAAIGRLHPRYRNAEVAWMPLGTPLEAIAGDPFDLDDARLVVARSEDFRDWGAVEAYTASLDGPAGEFEAAVEAVVDGDAGSLRDAIRRRPELVQARSGRVTCFDPPEHRATLLHYLAANGVENRRQRTPDNAVEMARILLEAGADANAISYSYGGSSTVLPLLVSSSHPAAKGLQVPLIDVLVEFGASVEPDGTGRWRSALLTALVFGYADAARALAGHGARPDVVCAAGLGTARDFQNASPEERHQALALAAQLGQAEVVEALLSRGEDPNRFNPEGFHSHATPLHQAALGGHAAVVELLVRHGARADVADKYWKSDSAGWAEHNGHAELAARLRECRNPL